MESVNVGDHVVITYRENRYCGSGAIVVSEPFDCEIKGIVNQVITVKVFSRDWSDQNRERKWIKIFMIFSLNHLRSDTERKFEMTRLQIKFGNFNCVFLSKEELDPKKECEVCHNLARKRIDINVWGSISQHDVCLSCAKKYDGIRTDGLPTKVLEETKKK